MPPFGNIRSLGTRRRLAFVLSNSPVASHRSLDNLLAAFGFEVVFIDHGRSSDRAPGVNPHLVVLDLGAPPPEAIRLLNRLSMVTPVPQAVLLGATVSAAGMGVVEFNQTVALGWLAKAWHVDDLGELESRLRQADAPPELPREWLMQALVERQFTLHYQPIYDIRRGHQDLAAMEALLRLEHPEHGLLLPGQFMPAVDREGLTARVADLTLELAAEQRKAWKTRNLAFPVAVNMGPEVLHDSALPGRLQQHLALWGIEPDDLILEISERGVMSQGPEPMMVATDLIERGFRLSIDDFGRGTISLTQVMSLRFHSVKLDETLIRQVSRNERVRQLVRGVVRLSHDLGMRTVAKCVESAEALFFLKGLGCDEAQGWHLGRPLPAGELKLG